MILAVNGCRNVASTEESVLMVFSALKAVALHAAKGIHTSLSIRSDGAQGPGLRLKQPVVDQAFRPHETAFVSRRPTLRQAVGLVLLGVVSGAGPHSAAGQSTGEFVDRTALRVCADPSNLPFSNDRGEGFENKIAELLAERLGRPLVYTWYPQTIGFVRNTLNALRCDLVMGVAVGEELVQNTDPYYRTSYVLVYRSSDAAHYADLDRPEARTARIGVMARSPPTNVLVRKGLLAAVRSYPPAVDTRTDQPAKRMIEDLAAGDIDIALSWGPIAGYWAPRQNVPLTLVPLESDRRHGPKLDSWISMGIRHNEPDWKHQINTLIHDLQSEIDRILNDYGVPLLDRHGRLITVDPMKTEPTMPTSGSRVESTR